MAKFKVGEHVHLKGIGLRGYSGTIVGHRPFRWYVQFDPGMTKAGNSMFMVTKRNMIKERA